MHNNHNVHDHTIIFFTICLQSLAYYYMVYGSNRILVVVSSERKATINVQQQTTPIIRIINNKNVSIIWIMLIMPSGVNGLQLLTHANT